jgi:hypothetical protein
MRPVVTQTGNTSRKTRTVTTDRHWPFEERMIQVVNGSMLCRLCVLTEEEWANLAPSQRPIQFVNIPGLGWVSAFPIASLN